MIDYSRERHDAREHDSLPSHLKATSPLDPRPLDEARLSHRSECVLGANWGEIGRPEWIEDACTCARIRRGR